MAKARTEETKRILMAQIPEDGKIGLQELWDRAGGGSDAFFGALQSMAARGEVNVSGLRDGDPEQILLSRPGENAGAGESELSAVARSEAARLLAAGIPQLRSSIMEQSGRMAREILKDGIPRAREELGAIVELPPGWPGGLPDVIKLPDNSYTLRDTASGTAELARRAGESRARAGEAQRQRRLLDELLAEHETLSEEEIEQRLGAPLLPEAAVHLMRLPGGRYTHPDSDDAWDEVGRYLSRSEPVSRKEFMRMFKRHKELVAIIKKGREEPPFVLLPDGRVTVETRPEGREELRRREILAYVHFTLKERMGGRSFFTLEDFAPRERALARQEALQAGCVALKINRRDIFGAPIKTGAEKIARELQELTGLDLPARGGATVPAAYLMENSLNTREAGRILGVRPGEVTNLYEQGHLQGFRLEGVKRFWRVAVETLRRSPNMERLLKRAERVKTSDAARILGITQDQVRRLLKDGYLRSAGRTGPQALQLRRGDVEDLLARLPEIKAGWEETPGDERPARRRKRRPRRREPETARTPGPIVLDEYQKKSIAALLDGYSVLVAAPTGTGKTLVAEKLVEHVLKQEREVIYTSPLKALSNQKYRDFARLYGHDRVGLITGDISINERAPLLVMTTEIFRNWCFSNPSWMDNITHVIFDEVHYLDDMERGTAWEESIIFAPSHIRILGLSATVPNINELACWMEEVRGERVVIVEEYRRAVPLVINWITPDYEVLDEEEAREETEALRQAGSRRQYMG
ncbi:MAG: DEAD/DEAH box helicase [Firmicutes bacterium]|nr:DEAD/DEAH box helicase [Bacillota bacterium]